MTYKLPEPSAHMFSDDLEKFAENETFAHAYSVAVSSPDGNSEPLFTTEQMHAAYAAGLADDAPKWLPIESAPKDGAEFDAWNGKERIADVFWSKPDYATKEHRAFCVYDYELGYGYVCTEVKNLTHWMPLPAAPETKP